MPSLRYRALLSKTLMILTLASFFSLFAPPKMIPSCYSSVLTSHSYYSEYSKCGKNFLILYTVIFLKNSLISDYPLICRHLLLFLFLHKKTMGAVGGKLIILLIKALFYSEFVFVQTYLQVYLIGRILVIYLQIYLIRNSLVWFGFMAKSGLYCALLSWEIPL